MTPSARASLVLTFPEYRAAGERLAAAAGLPAAPIDVHRFPDGESLVRLPVRASERLPERVLLVRSLDDPNAKLIELLLAADTARTLGATTVELVAPYLGYMRQDTAFRPGEAVSQRVVGAFLARAFDGLVTVDPHLHRTHDLAEVLPGTRARVLSATVPMAEFLKGVVDDPLLVGPDEESRQWVAALAAHGGFEFVVARKERRGDADVRVTLPPHPFAGRDAVLVDDIASTGRSLAATAAAVRAGAPRSVSALVTHGLFVDGAQGVLAAARVENVWSTDSVPNPTSRVTLARLLASAL